jgi:hypothetical protein
LFGDFGMDDKPSLVILELVDWEGELVSAVLRDIDIGAERKEVEKNEGAYRMEESIALKLLRSWGIDEETSAGGGGDGNAMEE